MVRNMMFTPTHTKKSGKTWQELEKARPWQDWGQCAHWDGTARSAQWPHYSLDNFGLIPGRDKGCFSSPKHLHHSLLFNW
jgi:hypothetical protein